MRNDTVETTKPSRSSLSVLRSSRDGSPDPDRLSVHHHLALLDQVDDRATGNVSRISRGSRINMAEGALALTILYALIGAGIGAAAGSFLLGLVVGAATGVAAVAAILLISGASIDAERPMDRGVAHFPHQVFRS